MNTKNKVMLFSEPSIPAGAVIIVRPDQTVLFVPPGGSIPGLPDGSALHMHPEMRKGVERAMSTRHVRARPPRIQ